MQKPRVKHSAFKLAWTQTRQLASEKYNVELLSLSFFFFLLCALCGRSQPKATGCIESHVDRVAGRQVSQRENVDIVEGGGCNVPCRLEAMMCDRRKPKQRLWTQRQDVTSKASAIEWFFLGSSFVAICAVLRSGRSQRPRISEFPTEFLFICELLRNVSALVLNYSILWK